MTEHAIQTYLWENKECWSNLIEDIKLPTKYDFLETEESIYSRSPDKVLFNEVIDRYSQLYKELKELELFGCEVPLKRDGDSTIRADLLGTIPGNSSIAIIELKKSSQTERQAYTELFAYASHLQAIFPTMSNEDIHYVLISPMEERIVREASIYSFLFDEKPVFAFIPVYENDDVTTLKLRPWLPNIDDLVKVSEAAFSQKNFNIFKVTWEDIEGWNAEAHKNPTDEMIARMNRISGYAAQIMESKKIHGFVYTSQGFPEMPMLNNAIIVAGLNPYKIAKDYYLMREERIAAYKLDSIPDEAINMLQIIPELKYKAKATNEENEHFYNLITSWSNTITGVAFDTIRTMTSNDQKLAFEKGWGGMTWKEYQSNMIEDGLVFNYDIKTTGLIRKLFTMYTLQDYEYITKFGANSHLYLFHGDVPNFFVDYVHRQRCFRDFLYHIFESFNDALEEFDDENKE